MYFFPSMWASTAFAGLHVLCGTLWLMGHISGHASCACLKIPSFVSYTPESPHVCVLEASETLGNSWGQTWGLSSIYFLFYMGLNLRVGLCARLVSCSRETCAVFHKKGRVKRHWLKIGSDSEKRNFPEIQTEYREMHVSG